MKLVKLNSTIAVNPEFVSSVSICGTSYTCKDYVKIVAEGVAFGIDPEYNQSVYELYDEIIKKLGAQE